MTKPTIQHSKNAVKKETDASGLEAPVKTNEVSIIVTQPRTSLNLKTPGSPSSTSTSWWILILWSLAATFSAFFSIYYAIDANNQLSEVKEAISAMQLTEASEYTNSMQNDVEPFFAEKTNQEIWEESLERAVEDNSQFFNNDNSPMDESLVVIELDGFSNEPKLFSAIQRLLSIPEFILDFHDMLHPMVEVINDAKVKGEQPNLTNEDIKSRMLLNDAPEFVKKWHKLLHPSDDELTYHPNQEANIDDSFESFAPSLEEKSKEAEFDAIEELQNTENIFINTLFDDDYARETDATEPLEYTSDEEYYESSEEYSSEEDEYEYEAEMEERLRANSIDSDYYDENDSDYDDSILAKTEDWDNYDDVGRHRLDDDYEDDYYSEDTNESVDEAQKNNIAMEKIDPNPEIGSINPLTLNELRNEIDAWLAKKYDK